MIRQATFLTGLFLAFLAPPTWGHSAGPKTAKVPLIARQPAYKEARQQYILLVLGQKPQTKIWIVRDGSDVYVDRNGNGDLTEPGEKVFQPDTNESASFVRLGMIKDVNGQEHGPLRCCMPTRGGGDHGQVVLRIAKKFEQEVLFLPLGNTPESACVVHFDGPLTATFIGYKNSRPVPTQDATYLTLSRKRPRRLQAQVGTQVKDFPVVSCVTFSITEKKKANWPRLKIVYENRDPRGAPIEKIYPLHEETRTLFSESVQAPANAGNKAKLTLIFTSPANVAPREIEVKVVD